MSKYKYEKEFMFSNKKLEEVELFLENEEHPLDLPNIRDNCKNTVIHHTAYHNQPRLLELYLKYYRKNLQSQNYTISEIKHQTRVFLDQRNVEGYTAAHYAAYRGNITVIKILQKYEADLTLTNYLKMGMLHLGAQGDKPNTFLYLHNKQFDINLRDAKLSTPLHWASFAGSEKIVEYLLAQPSIELDPVDLQGLTPLHLATTYGNSKIVKKLLIAGANRNIPDKKNKIPIQIATEKQFQGIRRMLNNQYSCLDHLKIICNAKPKYQPTQKSFIYPFSFFVLALVAIGLSYGAIEFQNIWLTSLQGSFYLVTILIFLSLVLGGKTQRDQSHDYTIYAENARFYNLCLICVREMRPREHHCPTCKTCIPQYDHHCTWINNCVGKHNIARFIIFIYTLQISLLWLAFLSIRVFLCLISGGQKAQFFRLKEWTQGDLRPLVYAAVATILLIALLFGIPLIILIMVQTKNLLLGKTTFERFSKSKQSILTRESSLLMNRQADSPPRMRFKNCLGMCLDREGGQKSDIDNSSTTSSFIREAEKR